MKNLVTALWILILSANVSADWTGHKDISKLRVQNNGVYLVLNGFQNSNPEINCGSNGFWMGFSNEQHYDARLSVLLAAKMSGKTVTLSYLECAAGYIKLGSVEVN